ncbi:hypothetical protein N431DRAFT_338191 [Stipitochalara longipes BDJ]|nr:hypothetical protein N431DRAFT_338191 [Stipitochalara longipes BDJ]
MDVSTFFDGDFGLELSEEPTEDRDALKKGRQSLGLSRSYVPSWDSRHAFREFFQNWSDAIIETNQFRQTQCKVIVNGFDSKNIYTAEVRHPTTQSLLGFIRWQDGTVEISNFQARMRREMLDIGVTTKMGSRETAGKHGEGFKIGGLVMTRNRYRVQYEASDFYWTFKFGGHSQQQLYCSLSPMSENKIQKLREKDEKRIVAGAARQLQSNIWEDVTVKIGKIRGIGEKVKKEDFLSWVNVSLDLNHPSRTIETRHGCLILDEEFAGRIYLKSLLLRGKSFEKPLKFGYNFFWGSVERDRTSLKKTGQEAKILAEIWEDAIRLHGSDVTDKYLALLRDDKTADVHKIEDCISEFTAKKIRSRLLEQDPERACFYHNTLNGDKDAEIIRNSLKKEPIQIPTPLWDSLRRFKLVRTPREQQCHLLHNAPVAEDSSSAYSAGVWRVLRAALALDVRTKDLEVVFKDGATTDFDLILFESTLEINNKWLDFKQSHSKTACWLSRQSNGDLPIMLSQFSCDHIVSALYELVLDEVMRHPGLVHRERCESKATLCQKISENFRHMPMMIETCLGGPGEIIVSWIDMDGGMVSRVYGLDPKLAITLHQESSCAIRRGDLLRTIKLSDSEYASPSLEVSSLQGPSCGCPSMVVPQKDLKATFMGLDHRQEYFPMIAREDPQAFFGLAPRSLRPRAPLPVPLSIQTRVEQPGNNNRRRNSPPKADIDHGDLYDADSPGEEIMQLDSPTPRPFSQSSASGPDNSTGDVPRDTPSRQFTPHRTQMREELQNLRVSHIPPPPEYN